MEKRKIKKKQYILLDHIKTGGFGTISRALQHIHGIERLVVIKKIKPEIINHEDHKESFIDEIRTTFPLNHPNIAQTFDYGEEDGQLFCVLEYIQGVTLREIQKKLDKIKGHIDLTHVIYIIMEAAKGLHYAHQYKDQFNKNAQRIVHRDISPQNIMVNFEGIVKVIDFGIAKAKSNINTTQVGVYKGKPAYMAPEYISPGIYDHRFDQFSLGVVFWELSTGKKLFTGNNYIEVIKKIHKCEVPLPRFYNENIDHDLQEVILKMLNKNPRKRFRNLELVHAELDKLLHRIDPNYTSTQFKDFIQQTFRSEIIWENAKIKKVLESYRKS